MSLKILDIESFLENYLAYCRAFNGFPDKKITDKYVEDNSLEWVSFAYWLEVIGYGINEKTFRCSSCEGMVHEKTKYCPNCGARMKAPKIKKLENGRWIHTSQGYVNVRGRMYPRNYYKCSKCGYEVELEKAEPPKYSICPNCGIKMEECEDAAN